MLQQTLADRAEQQAGETATATRADNHHIMAVAGLGQRMHRRPRHDAAVHGQIRVLLLQRSHTCLQIVHVGVVDAVVGADALDFRHRGNHFEFGVPGCREIGGDLQGLDTPLGFVGADGHLGDGVVQMHEVAIVVGVGHHDDRAVRICRKAGGCGAEQAFGKAALAAVADNDEVVVAGQFHEHGGRVAGDDEGGGLNALLVGDCLGLR